MNQAHGHPLPMAATKTKKTTITELHNSCINPKSLTHKYVKYQAIKNAWPDIQNVARFLRTNQRNNYKELPNALIKHWWVTDHT